MDRLHVKSSRIQFVGYDRHKKEMEVQLRDGNYYLFDEVPANFYIELMVSPSIGNYFFNNIKETFPIREHRQGKFTSKV